MRNAKAYLLAFLVFSSIIVFGEKCECALYSKALNILNIEYDKLFKPYYLATIIDSTFDPTNPPFDSDTFYTSKFTTNHYKFFISDKVNKNYWSKSFVDFMASEYKRVSEDSLFKIDTFTIAQPTNLYNCRFKEVDSISLLHFNDTNYVELNDRVNNDFSTQITHFRNHTDTINYSPIVIFFYEIVYLNNNLAYFNISYNFSHRQSSRSVFFRKEKNQWRFYKFGKVSQF